MKHQLQGSNTSNPQFFSQDGMRVAFQPSQFPQNQKPIKLNKNAFIGIGITQMIIGVICIILNIVLIVLKGSYSIVGYGIWGGGFFFISGMLSLLTGKTSINKCLIVSTMVMNIISACVTMPVLAGSLMDALTYIGRTKYNYTIYPYDNGMGSTIAVLAIIEAIISITCSALCCRAYCCCCSQADRAVVTTYGYPGNLTNSNYSEFQAPVTFSPQFSKPPPNPQQQLVCNNNGLQINPPPPYDYNEKY